MWICIQLAFLEVSYYFLHYLRCLFRQISNCNFIVIPLDTNKRGEKIEEDRPCGADSECRQAAKTINADGQKRLRAEKRGRELGKKYNEAKLMHSVIQTILERNK